VHQHGVRRAAGSELFRLSECAGRSAAFLHREPEPGEESLGGLREKVDIMRALLPGESERIASQSLPEPLPLLGRSHYEGTKKSRLSIDFEGDDSDDLIAARGDECVPEVSREPFQGQSRCRK